jgi:hypothetical protein
MLFYFVRIITPKVSNTKKYFELEKDSLNLAIKSLEQNKNVNAYLQKNDWFFISPIFFQGIELNYLDDLSKKQNINHKNEIIKLVSAKFYNLGWTASFIEGYCRRCNHIEPFLKSIENSLILTFQRDYEGSIKTLIPIIEGILRKYLTIEKGLKNNEISFKELKGSFIKLKNDLIGVYEANIGLDQPITYDAEQIKILIDLKSKYYEVWFSRIETFVNQSFYLKTKDGTDITNEINRHSILHEWGLDTQYNLENYLKIYFLLQFLTWAFLIKEGKSPLNQISGFRYLEKIESYRAIIKKSNNLLYEKHLLMKEYSKYNKNIYKEQFIITFQEPLPFKYRIQYKILKKLGAFFWKTFDHSG